MNPPRQNDVNGTEQHGRSRNVMVNLSIFQFLTFLRRGVFYTFMINYLFTLMGTITSTAALGTMNMIASALGQNLLWGRICDRCKSRARLIIAGETIAAFAYIAVFFAHTSLISMGDNFGAGLSIIFGLSILEFFWSMSDVGWAALLTDITTPKIRGTVVGTLNFIASLGRTFGITFAGFLYNEGEGFRNGTIFYTVAVLLLIGAALMTWTSRYVGTKAPRNKEEDPDGPEPQGSTGDEKTFKWLLASLVVIILGAASASQVFLRFLEIPKGLEASGPEMSLVLTAWTLGGMAASLTMGRFSDKIGRSKAMLVGLGLATATPLFYGFALKVPIMAVVYGLNGVAFWTMQTVGFVLAGDLIPQHKRGRLMGRYNTVMALSWGPAGFLIGGPFADMQTRLLGLPENVAYVNAFYLSSSILLVGVVLFALKVARQRK